MSNFNNLSEARLNANRQNAQHSTGPRTEAGRLVSSKNAVKTALTGRTVLLPSDDADRYGQHVQAFVEEWQPEGQRETLLAQSLADIAWRIERVASFEMAIFAKDRAEFAHSFAEEPEPIRSAIVELEIARMNARELRNLALQEARLRRQRDRDTDELRYLQAERKRLIEERLELAAHVYRKSKSDNKPFDLTPFGFVFSIEEIENYWTVRKAKMGLEAMKPASSAPAFRRPKAA
jgi:hypothetical protein